MIQSETTFTRSDGALVRFVPSEYDGPSVASASSSSTPTEDDIKPCLTRTYSDWNGWSPCNIEDRLLASTDFGLGHRIRLDGVTSHYQVNWRADGVNLSSSYQFDSRCPNGWYLDYGGPLAGDEVCWSPGILYVAWYYPAHPPGSYTFYRSAGNVLFPNDSATVLPGTLHAENGNGQTTLVNEVALASLEVGLRDFRGNRVRFPIHPYNDRRNAFVFSVIGPRRSEGAAVTPSAVQPDEIGTAKVKFRAGDKPGNYYISVESEDAEPLTPAFTIAAVERMEPEDNKELEEGNGEEQCTVADPISIGIGNSFQQDTDYRQTGLSILEFVRSYNALGSKSRLMRNYWTTTFDRAILRPQTAEDAIRVRRPDGRVIPFRLVDGKYQSLRPYFHGRLVAYGDGWQYITEDNITDTHDATGRWIRTEDANGRRLDAHYNSKGLLIKVSTNTGESVALSYNKHQQLSELKDHTGRIWTYVYNGYANLIRVGKPDGIYHTYHYESPHSPYLLTGITVSRSEVATSHSRYVTWEYDEKGRATANYLRDGLLRYDILYNDATNERVVRDALGNESLYQAQVVDGRGFVDGVVGPGFASCGMADMAVERDSRFNVVSRTSFGRTTVYGDHDERGQYGFIVEAPGTPAERRTEYLYDPRFLFKPNVINEPSVAPGKRKTTTIHYDERGNVVRQEVSGFTVDGTPVSRVVALGYEGPLGQISWIDGPRTDVVDVTRFEYDGSTQRLVRVVDPNGIPIRSKITYTATGEVASEERPNGTRIEYSYYPGSGLLESVAEIGKDLARVTAWTYDDHERVASIIVSDGVNEDQATLFTYNAAGDVVSVRSPGVGQILYDYDQAGNRVRDRYVDSSYREARWLKRTFDAYGRVRELINPYSVVATQTHPDGTVSEVTDGEGLTTTYEYDEIRRLTRAIQPGQIVTSFDYDAGDRLRRVTDANAATTGIEYDDLGNKVRYLSLDAGTSFYEYDPAGNLVRSLNALGEATSYSYDAGGRIVAVDRVGTADDETYTYDDCRNGIGRVCKIANGIGESVAYEYDDFGRVGKQSTNAGTLAYAYDGSDNVVSITYPSQRVVHYEHNAAGQAVRVTVSDGGNRYVIARDVRYLPFGPASSWTYGNGLTEHRTFDLQYRPISFRASDRSVVTYGEYDGNDNPLRRNVNGDAQVFSYDALGRLESATGAFGAREYRYDAVGNRTRLDADGRVTEYAYQPHSNRIASDTDWTYTLDATGSEVRRESAGGGGWELVHTAKNRLLGVLDLENPAATIGAYRYNALGQRTIKSTPHGDRLFVYGLSGQLLSELLPGGSVVQEYVYLNGAPIALLGTPSAPASPIVVDQIIDNMANAYACVSKRSKKAIGDEYLECDIYRSGSQIWPWRPEIAGDYDVYVHWAWRSAPQCYRFEDGASCTGEGERAGTWVSLGSHHLSAGKYSPLLDPNDNYRFGTGVMNVDAIRYVLRQADLTARDYKYVHADALGTPVAATDREGKVVWSARHDPFGTAAVSEDPDGDGVATTLNLRFPGQYFDAETGLHYNYYRDYSPALGRYLQSDPIGLAGGINTYAYVSGNPVNLVDPLGLCEGEHKYEDKTLSPCSPTAAFNALKQPNMSAPGAPAAREGLTTPVVLWGNGGNNRISQYVNSETRTIVNTTLEGHQFYPGTVTWQVTSGPGGYGSMITVTGTGSGPNPMWNNMVGLAYFPNTAALAAVLCMIGFGGK
jgi:RHS repeat-associated protein